MADLKAIYHQITELANTAAAFIPAVGVAATGLKIGEKVIDLIDGLHGDADERSQAEMLEARRKLQNAIAAKSKATSDRLRNG